jgi:hypothetical protein
MTQTTILIQAMMHATMLVQEMMQVTNDGGVYDKWSLTFSFHHYAPNWVSPIPYFMVFMDVYVAKP